MYKTKIKNNAGRRYVLLAVMLLGFVALEGFILRDPLVQAMARLYSFNWEGMRDNGARLVAWSGDTWRGWDGERDGWSTARPKVLGESRSSDSRVSVSVPAQGLPPTADSSGENMAVESVHAEQESASQHPLLRSVFSAVFDGHGDDWGWKYESGDIVLKRNNLIRLRGASVDAREIARHGIESGNIDSNAVNSRTIDNHSIQNKDIDNTIDLEVNSLTTTEGVSVGGNLSVTGTFTIAQSQTSGNGLTVSGGNVLFSTSGTINQSGTGQVTFAGNLDANGGLDTTSLTVSGNTTLGDASSDTLTVNAQLASHLVPSVNNTYDLGSSTNYFRSAYISSLATSGGSTVAGDFSVDGNTTLGNALSDTLTVNGSSVTLSGFTSNGGPLYTNGSGVLAQTTAGTATQVLHGGATPTFGAVVLTTDVSGTLPIANGGTNATTIGSAGSLAYSTGSAYAFSGVGTTGQALISGGTGAPTWFAPTAGSILFAGTSGILSQDNANFFWDDTNNRLGLGTTTPGAKLEIKDSGIIIRDDSPYGENKIDWFADGANNYARIVGATGSNWGGILRFYTSTVGGGSGSGGTERMTIYENGNVGINDATPAALFTVGSGDLFQVNSSGNLVKINNIAYSWPASQGAASTILTNDGSGTLTWGTLAAASVNADAFDFTELQDQLDLDASTDILADGSEVFSLTNTGTGNSFVINDASGDTTPFVIDASGNVGIGTSSPTAKLEVSTTALISSASGNPGLWVNKQDAGITNTYWGILNTGTGSTANNHLAFGNNSSAAFSGFSERMVVTNAGNVGIGDTSPAALLTVGSGDLFQVNSSGAIAAAAGITSSGTITFSGLSTGIVHANASGVLSSSAVNLASADVTGTLPIANGGTNATTIGSAGSLAYSTGSAYAFSGVGTTGQALVSGGTGAPTWFAPTAGSVLFAGTSGILSQDNANFFWDDTNNRLGLGTTGPTTALELYSSASADNVLTITSASATYDPILKFRTGASPSVQFSLGVDTSDSSKFKIYSGDGLGSGDEFTIDSSGVTSIANLSLGAQSFEADAGAISWIDMPVTSGATAGTVESYTAQLDGTTLLTVYGEADGTGGVQNTAIGIGTSTPTTGSKLAVSQTSTTTTAGSLYGLYNSVSDTGIVTTGTDTTYGSYLSLTRTGATGGTVTSYGDYILLSTDNAGAGTSVAYGSYLDTGVAGAANADTVYGQYITTEANSSTTAYGLYVDAGSGAGTEYAGIFMNGKVGIGIAAPTALLHLTGTAGTVGLELNSNETTGTNNILMLRSDVASADDAVFRVRGDGAVFADGAYTGTGADYAEYFLTSDATLEPGEVVCIDPAKSNAIRRCDRDGDNDAMGIVSTHPSLVGNGADGRDRDSRYKIIGMIGQVPGKVTALPLPIRIGDSLTPSAIPGVLRKAEAGETTVGIALQNSEKSQDTIQVLISRRNKSVTVEKVEDAITARIAEMNMEDQVNNLVAQATQALLQDNDNLSARVSALEEAIGFVTTEDGMLSLRGYGDMVSKEDLATLREELGGQNTVSTVLQEQLMDMESKVNSLMDFYSTLQLGNVVTADADGNVDLLGGQLRVGEITASGVTIEVVEENAPTIGSAILYPKAVDENQDGNDDWSGLAMTNEAVQDRDGKSVTVETGAIDADSRVYITPVGSTNNQVLYVSETHVGKDFRVGVDSVATLPLHFNWWIVKEK